MWVIFFSLPPINVYLKLTNLVWLGGCLFAAIAGATDPVNAIIFAEVLAIFKLNDPARQQELAVLYGVIFLGLGAISLIAFTTEVGQTPSVLSET